MDELVLTSGAKDYEGSPRLEIQPPPRVRTYVLHLERIVAYTRIAGIPEGSSATTVEFHDRVLFCGCTFFHERENGPDDKETRHRRFVCCFPGVRNTFLLVS